MTNRIVVIGCGGQGREIGRMLIDAGFELAGYIDDNPSPRNYERLTRLGIPHVGGIEVMRHVEASHYVIGISAGRVRERIAPIAEGVGLVPLTYIHPTATVGGDSEIGPGSIVWPGVRLTSAVRVGCQVHLNQNVTIGHDTVVHAFATVNPSATVSGEVEIGSGALVGAGSVILQGLAVGADATVGAAACLTANLPASAVAVGVPARW